MAIDTENRRRSTLAVLPIPDSTIGAADRLQATWHYSGILVVEAWTDPTCTITTDVTMPGNSVTTDVTRPGNTLTDDVTMATDSITDDVGMGCGLQ